MINLIILRRPTHLKSLQTALNTSFTSLLGLPRSAASYAYFEFGFPPLRLQCDLALVRLFCRLTLSPPDTLHHRLFQIRRSYPAGPHKSSIEYSIQSALIRLGRPFDFNAFNPPHVVAISRRPERAYARFLRPALTRLWIADILSLPSLPLPWTSSLPLVPPPPGTRQHNYISLVVSDLIRPNLFSPAHWLKTHPTLPFTLSLLRLRCQGSVLPTHTALSPSNVYIPYDDRRCPHCPLSVGDELHTFLSCPVLHLRFYTHFKRLQDLLLSHGLHALHPTLSPSSLISLLLSADPFPLLKGKARSTWMHHITPLSIEFARSVHLAFHPSPLP